MHLFGVFVFFLSKNPVILNLIVKKRGKRMSKIIFNEHQRRVLVTNPNVASASDRAIQYTPEFKIHAVKENIAGKGPVQIFIEAGFDLQIIGTKKAQSSLTRWKTTFKTYGEDGFFEERRGKGSTGRPNSKNLSSDKKLEKAEARIKYLEAELELLKKLDELERQAKKKRQS